MLAFDWCNSDITNFDLHEDEFKRRNTNFITELTKSENTQAFIEIGRCKFCHMHAGKKRLFTNTK
ncbi:MAG: hypothetical protein HYV97_19980 [Bdellovibrio sp.]|nr:hypothetical protein [Bdellovibrio sp.]